VPGGEQADHRAPSDEKRRRSIHGAKVERLVAAHPIPGDANALLAVNIQDFLAVLAAWGHCTGCGEEFDHDGMVGNNDLRIVPANWGL